MDPGISRKVLYYLTTDCTGAPYSYFPNGTVYLAGQPDGVFEKYYTPKISVAQNITPLSFTNFPSEPCYVFTQSTQWLFPASKNVPDITGVANIMYALPITFQRQ